MIKIKENERGGAHSIHGRQKIAYKILVEYLKGRNKFVYVRMTIVRQYMFKEYGGRMWPGFIWLRRGTSGTLLLTW